MSGYLAGVTLDHYLRYAASGDFSVAAKVALIYPFVAEQKFDAARFMPAVGASLCLILYRFDFARPCLEDWLLSRLCDPGYVMSPSPLPLIEEVDFPRFQRMIAELRNVTYEEWTDDHRRAIVYRVPRNGFKEVPVSPEEFDLWLKQTRNVAHLELLWAFAEEKAAGPLQVARFVN